ncbi:MAG: ABC transporter substrate-binding protein, partial [Desulfovibrionales bacterium]|nr:ABC transporter substrate-binding protein [Desulfovibrionales bacterium]
MMQRIPSFVYHLVVLALVYCAVHSPTTAYAKPDPSTLQRIRLQLKWKHQFQFAGYYAALQQGFFHQEGLDVEIIEGHPGRHAVQELERGNVDYAVDAPAVILERAKGAPVVVIGAIFQHSPDIVLTRASDELLSPHSLRGKRIMNIKEMTPEISGMFLNEGVPPNSITWLDHTWTVDDLIAGRVDAQSAYSTNEPFVLQEQGIRPAFIRPSTYSIDFYGDCLLTSEQEARNHPERVQAFFRATQRGWEYAMAHPEEMAHFIHTTYNPDKSIPHLLFEAQAMRELILPDVVEIGHMNPARWQHIIAIYTRLGMLSGSVDLRSFLYPLLREDIYNERRKTIQFTLLVLGGLSIAGSLAALIFIGFTSRLRREVRERTAALTASEQHFRAFFEQASVGVAHLEEHTGRIIRFNAKLKNMLQRPDLSLLGTPLVELLYSDDQKECADQFQALSSRFSHEFTAEYRVILPDQNLIWLLLSISLVHTADEASNTLLVIARDVTERKRAEEKLKLAAKVFETSIEGIVITDSTGAIEQVNKGFTVITGYEPQDVLGKDPRILKSDRHDPAFYHAMWKQIAEQGFWAGEIWNRRKNGEPYPEWLTISAVKNDHGQVTQYISIFHDISEIKRHQEALSHQSQHDALTGLPNKLLLMDRVHMALARRAQKAEKLALLFLDLDNFKHINEALGHKAGDELLIRLSKRLTQQLRPEDTLARLGGDEFLLLLPSVTHIEVAGNVAAHLLDSLQEPFIYQDVELYLSASIGVTIAPDDGDEADTLIKNADMAMYRAKHLGRNNYQFFTPEMDALAHRRISLESKLRRAIEREEFELHYQPLVDMSSGRIVGAEALARWRHEGKLISPAEFIPLAEDSGLIIPLGTWVLQTAARQAAAWQAAGNELSISVNISSRQFAMPDMDVILRTLLRDSALEPGRLYFEITESLLMTDMRSAQHILEKLRAQGIHFFLDDFGTGYSS